MTDELNFVVKRIERGIARQGRYLVTAPAEKLLLGDIADALCLAEKKGWMLVCHLGGEYFEFFEGTHSPQQARW